LTIIDRQACSEIQQAGREDLELEDVDFGRRMATHRELTQHPELYNLNALFDESGYFLIYPSIVGIKIVNLVSRETEAVLGTLPYSSFLLHYLLQENSRTRRGSSTLPCSRTPTPRR